MDRETHGLGQLQPDLGQIEARPNHDACAGGRPWSLHRPSGPSVASRLVAAVVASDLMGAVTLWASWASLASGLEAAVAADPGMGHRLWGSGQGRQVRAPQATAPSGALDTLGSPGPPIRT